MNIAFFDSGIGGLTVLHQAIKTFPKENFIYFGDCLNAPYGKKNQHEIQTLTESALQTLSQFNLKIAVIACNTATSAAIDKIRQIYNFPIIGMEPSVKPAIENNQKAIITATDLTLQGTKLKNLVNSLQGQNRVTYLSLQELVTFAEKQDLESNQITNYLKTKFQNINWQEFHSLVLGCTHFIYFKPQIKKLIPKHIKILDGISGTINQLKNKMPQTNNKNKNNQITYYLSGYSQEQATQIAKQYLTFLDKNA